MSIKTPDGLDFRKNLLEMEGVDESLVKDLESKTIDYLRLFFRIKTGQVKSDQEVTGPDNLYMGKWRKFKKELGELEYGIYRILPADLVMENGGLSPESALAMRQYMTALIEDGVRRLMVNKGQLTLVNPDSEDSFEQVVSVNPIVKPGKDAAEYIRPNLGDISGVWREEDTTPGSSSEVSMSHHVEFDLEAENDLYNNLLATRLVEKDSPEFFRNMPIVTMRPSFMRQNASRKARFGLIDSNASQDETAGVAVGAVMDRFVSEGRADRLSDEDRVRYEQGVMPWKIVADYYGFSNKPEVRAVLEEAYRKWLTACVSLTVTEGWRKRDPDDFDDFDD